MRRRRLRRCLPEAARDQVREIADILRGFDFSHPETDFESVFNSQHQRNVQYRRPFFYVVSRKLRGYGHGFQENIVEYRLQALNYFTLGHVYFKKCPLEDLNAKNSMRAEPFSRALFHFRCAEKFRLAETYDFSVTAIDVCVFR